MIKINDNYLKLQASYLFSDIAKRIAVYEKNNPQSSIIKLGIGDVTQPLPQACLEAFHSAIDEMGNLETFRGYGPEQGYPFFRECISEKEFKMRGIPIEADEIFISDGSKCDTGNIQEIFATELRVAVPDPVYPAYVDTNVMAGRTLEFEDNRYKGLVYLECSPENNYVSLPPAEPVDLIYLCFPNNPTGAVINHKALKEWVDYAHKNRAIILYDAAYVAFIRDESLPKSIYEIEGAREVAIEFRSFSKNAGFTGTRCAYTIVPKNLNAYDAHGNKQPVHSLWNRRHTTRFNGVSYPVQKAAAAVYTSEGQKQVKALTDYYLANAAKLRQTLTQLGFPCLGGDNAPYIWVNVKKDSWEFFDYLLKNAGVVCTPGAGFGRCGKGHIRLSAFNTREKVNEAVQRIEKALRSF